MQFHYGILMDNSGFSCFLEVLEDLGEARGFFEGREVLALIHFLINLGNNFIIFISGYFRGLSGLFYDFAMLVIDLWEVSNGLCTLMPPCHYRFSI
jgi:hypothetical protein